MMQKWHSSCFTSSHIANFELIYKETIILNTLKLHYDSDTYSQFKVLNADLLSL